jgi:hypothetical protein
MRKSWLGLGGTIRAIVAGAVVMGAGATDPTQGALPRMWGADRAILTLDDQGGRLDFDCGYAIIAGPVTFDRAGRFKAKGAYFAERGGPVVDRAPSSVAARFDGKVTGANLRLRFEQAGGGGVQTYAMIAGKRPKLIRCL